MRLPLPNLISIPFRIFLGRALKSTLVLRHWRFRVFFVVASSLRVDKCTDVTTDSSLRLDIGAARSSSFSEDYLKVIDSLPFDFEFAYLNLLFVISNGETLLTTRMS